MADDHEDEQQGGKGGRDASSNLEQMALEVGAPTGLLSRDNQHLKWRAFDYLEMGLAVICAGLLMTFTLSTAFDVLTRNLGRSFLLLQELTLGTFVWGVFLGAAVALRRRQHFYLTVAMKKMTGAPRIILEVLSLGTLVVVFGLMTWFGYLQFQSGLNISMQVSTRPLALLTGSIPVFGLLGLLFTLEELINGLRGGFAQPLETMADDVVSPRKGD